MSDSILMYVRIAAFTVSCLVLWRLALAVLDLFRKGII